MSKLAHSCEETMFEIELANRLRENPGTKICPDCDGTGDHVLSFNVGLTSAAICTTCNGEGILSK